MGGERGEGGEGERESALGPSVCRVRMRTGGGEEEKSII